MFTSELQENGDADMRFAISILGGASVLVAFAYIALVTYLFLTGSLSVKAPFLASYGVTIGIVAVAGTNLGLQFFELAKSDRSGAFLGFTTGLCMLMLVGLHLAMNLSGDFGEAVLGPLHRLFDWGYYAGLAVGACMITAL